MLTLAAVFLIQGVSSGTEDWYEHVSEKGHYRIRFPSEPLVDEQVRTTPDGERKLHRAICVHRSVSYQVIYLDIDVRSEWGYRFDSETAFQAVSERMNARLQSSDRVSLDGEPGDRAVSSNDQGYRAEFIAVLVRDRVFIVGCETQDPDAVFDLRAFMDTFKFRLPEGTVTPKGALIKGDGLTREVALRNWKALYIRGRSWSHRVRSPGGTDESIGLDVVGVENLTAIVRPFTYVGARKSYNRGSDYAVSFEAEWNMYVDRRNADPPLRATYTSERGSHLVCHHWSDNDHGRSVRYDGKYAPFLIKTGSIGGKHWSLFTFDDPPGSVFEPTAPSPAVAPKTAHPIVSGPVTDILQPQGERIEALFRVSYGQPPFKWSVSGLPKGPIWQADQGTMTVSGVIAILGEWNIEVQVTDSLGRSSSMKARIASVGPREPEPANAGTMVFVGGGGRAGMHYRAEIEISPPGRARLNFKCDTTRLPPGVEAALVEDKSIRFEGLPTSKGEFNFDVVLEAVLTEFNDKKVSSTLAVSIVIEAGPHEPLEPLLGNATVIAIEDGPYGLIETDLLKQALSCLVLSLQSKRLLNVWLRQNGSWEPYKHSAHFVCGGSGDTCAISYRIRAWGGFSSKNPTKAGEAWKSLSAEGLFSRTESDAVDNALIMVTPLNECDDKDRMEKLKAALEVFALKKEARIGIVTTRAEIPKDFRTWLESKSFVIVQLQR
ncbi:MAG: hypothetical protein KBG84_08305 [Planctomycetes bacterium]|nr:hypothetical protein [Planctomycetota bacterium]